MGSLREGPPRIKEIQETTLSDPERPAEAKPSEARGVTSRNRIRAAGAKRGTRRIEGSPEKRARRASGGSPARR
jgi:hypothetical protein